MRYVVKANNALQTNRSLTLLNASTCRCPHSSPSPTEVAVRLLSQRRRRTFPHGWAFKIRRADHTASEVPHTATCEGCKSKGVVQGVKRGGVKGAICEGM